MLKIGLCGAGLIGREHIEFLSRSKDASLAAIADPAPEAKAVAEAAGVAWFSDYRSMLAAGSLDGVIVALPNKLHRDAAEASIAHGVPVLVEKPIADNPDDALVITEASERSGVPVLVGHQRRYAPDIAAAKQYLDSGALGQIRSVTVMSLWKKDEEYFNAVWRRQRGGGPILINLIHDLDVLRYLFGEITSVFGVGSNHARGFEVPDTAGAVLNFESGAIGNVSLSDAAASPLCWDISSGYGAYFPHTPADVYFIAGSEGTLAIPSLTVFKHKDNGSWHDPIERETLARVEVNPYEAQLAHFVQVIRGEAAPIISARDALGSLLVARAISESIEQQRPVHINTTKVPSIHA